MNLAVGAAREKVVGSVVILMKSALVRQVAECSDAHIAERKLEVLKKKTNGSVGTCNDDQHR